MFHVHFMGVTNAIFIPGVSSIGQGSLFIPSILIGLKHMHYSPQPVTDDQIWKKFVFNEEMTSEMQLSIG